MTTKPKKRSRVFTPSHRKRFERAARQYLRDCFRNEEPVRAQGLARTLGITPEYASWLAGQLLGIPLIDWLRAKRVAYAETLLRRKTLSLAEVARKAGFGGIRSLQRAFRELRGMTLSEFRNLAK